MTRCKTGKHKYRSASSATKVMYRQWQTARGRVLPARCYRCPHCDSWHLTSQAAKNTERS